MENRRINQRFKLHQMVEINYLNEEIFINAAAINISIGGMQCRMNNQLETVSDLFLMFEIPNKNESHIIKCYGNISWQEKKEDGYYAGIVFVNMFRDDKEILQKYIDSLA